MKDIKFEYLVEYEDKPITKQVLTLEEIENRVGGLGFELSKFINKVTKIHKRLCLNRTDINGADIFVGDIIVIHYSQGEVSSPMVIEYEDEDGAFRMNEYRGSTKLYAQLPFSIEFEQIEVVGNRVEDPELI